MELREKIKNVYVTEEREIKRKYGEKIVSTIIINNLFCCIYSFRRLSKY
jgi:hypothetical protein